MHARMLGALALVWVLTLPASSPADESTQDDFAKVAEKLAPEIREKAVAKLGDQSFRVAVFPFGDTDGKVTIAMNEPNTVVQGELIVNLIKIAQGAYLVLDKAGLKREFKNAGIDPSKVAANDPKNTADALKKIGVHVAVVGSIDAKSAKQVVKDNLTKINVTVTVIYQDGTHIQLTGKGSPQDIPAPSTVYTGRLRAQLFLTGGGNTEEIRLITSKKPDSEFHRVFFAEIPDNLPFGTNGASYKIRISNQGKPHVGYKNPQDQQRLFGVAVLVDGVSSFYQDPGNRTIGPVVVHPRHAHKWVLAGPGQKLVPDKAKPNGYRLENVRDAGHSVIDIPGFQKNEEMAEKFLFAEPRESIAETVGITNDIGVITVHFYPESMPGDESMAIEVSVRAGVKIGTKPGSPVHNPVFTVRPKFYPNPVEVWRIFYRKKGDCPIPPEDRIPIEDIAKSDIP